MILRPTRAASKAGLPRSSSAKFTHFSASTHASSASAFAASNSHPVQQTLSLDGILMKKQKESFSAPLTTSDVFTFVSSGGGRNGSIDL